MEIKRPTKLSNEVSVTETPAQQSVVNSEPKKLSRGLGDIKDSFEVESAGNSVNGIDLTQMPLDDAMVFLMMQISQDARSDMKDMLKEMEKTKQGQTIDNRKPDRT